MLTGIDGKPRLGESGSIHGRVADGEPPGEPRGLIVRRAAFPDHDDTRRLVFTNRHGTPVRRSTASDIWHRTADRIEHSSSGREGWHALRHYYASLLIRHSESVKVVQSRLGHASAAETLDTYSHLWPDSDDRTRDAVDEVLGAIFPRVPTASTRPGTSNQ